MSEEAKANISIFKRLVTYALPYKKLFFTALLAVILIAVSSVYRPILISEIVDKYIIILQFLFQ
jgi:ATP-binding cassette subfamily B protein